MQNYDVEFYEQENGKIPMVEFLNSLDINMKSKVIHTISLLQDYGNELREPYTKYIKDGIFEFRVKQGSNITRSFYFFITGKKIIMTNGFVKKTSKTPQNEFEKAKKYKKSYENRY